MTSATPFSRPDKEFGGARRTPEGERLQGERRSGGWRLSPRAATWIYVLLTGAVLTFADVRFYRGAHSVQLAVNGGSYAGSLAARWINSGFPR